MYNNFLRLIDGEDQIQCGQINVWIKFKQKWSSGERGTSPQLDDPFQAKCAVNPYQAVDLLKRSWFNRIGDY